MSTKNKYKPRSTKAKRPPSSSSRLWIGLVAIVVVAGVLAIVLTRGDDEADAGAEIAKSVRVVGEPLPDYPPDPTAEDPAIGRTPPELFGRSPAGEKTSITFSGKPALVVLVAHWCPHCQAEVPRLVEAAGDGATDGVDVSMVTTSTDELRPNYPPSEWLERERWPFSVLADDADQQAAAAYGLLEFPFLVFVDADGKVVRRASGEIPAFTLDAMLRALAAGEPVPSPTPGESSTG